jgi:RNA polymerase sigma-70 factor (ECF subfamily)
VRCDADVVSQDQVRDHLLVLRGQAGDDTAFSALYARFGERTRRYLKNLLGGSLADDAQQEVWLSVYRRLSTLADPGAFKTWLFQVTRHQAIDMLRRQDRAERLKDEVQGTREGSGAVVDGPTLPEPTSPELESALTALSEVQREVVILRYWEDMTYAEIAVVTGTPVGTVRSRLHHAKAKLREELDDRG